MQVRSFSDPRRIAFRDDRSLELYTNWNLWQNRGRKPVLVVCNERVKNRTDAERRSSRVLDAITKGFAVDGFAFEGGLGGFDDGAHLLHGSDAGFGDGFGDGG